MDRALTAVDTYAKLHRSTNSRAPSIIGYNLLKTAMCRMASMRPMAFISALDNSEHHAETMLSSLKTIRMSFTKRSNENPTINQVGKLSSDSPTIKQVGKLSNDNPTLKQVEKHRGYPYNNETENISISSDHSDYSLKAEVCLFYHLFYLYHICFIETVYNMLLCTGFIGRVPPLATSFICFVNSLMASCANAIRKAN